MAEKPAEAAPSAPAPDFEQNLREMNEMLQQKGREDYDRLRRLYGFDDPIYLQYGKWLWQLLQLNPGYSREYGQPVFDINGEFFFGAQAFEVFQTVIESQLELASGQ